MKKLFLKTSTILQGDFKLADVNILLVFQVNCPGCFLHAFPIANKIFENYREKGIKVLALSTAFEDFDYNTLENTKLLLGEGKIVGETKKALNKFGHNTIPFKISFDVAFDQLEKNEVHDLEKEIESFCRLIPDFENKNSVEKKLIKAQAKQYLQDKTMKALTFDTNFLMGTPSWIIFDKGLNILYDSFGHREYEELERALVRAMPHT